MSAPSTPSQRPSPRRAQTPSKTSKTAEATAPRDHAAGSRVAAREAAKRRQTLIGGISIASALAVIVVVVLLWQQHKAAESQTHAELARAQGALKAEVEALSLVDAAQAARAVRRLEETKPQWERWRSSEEFAVMLSKAQVAVATATAARSMQQAIEDLDRKVAAGPPDVAAWNGLRERAAALAQEAKQADKDMKQRLTACSDRIDDGLLAALRAAIAASGADARATRQHLIAAQTLVASRFEAADAAHDAVARKRWDDEFMALAKQEDTLAAANDAAAVAALPWQDLLAGAKTADWIGSNTAGLGYSVTGGALAIEAKDAGDKRGGVVVLKDHEWRHCEVEFDLTLLSGTATLLLRAGKSPAPRTSAAVKFASAEQPNAVVVPSGQATAVHMRLVGDRLAVTAAGHTTEVRVPPHVRTGKLAVVVETGTSLRLGALKVKDLQ